MTDMIPTVYYDMYYFQSIIALHCSVEPSRDSNCKVNKVNKYKRLEEQRNLPRNALCVCVIYGHRNPRQTAVALPTIKPHISFAHLHQQHVFLLSDLDQVSASLLASHSPQTSNLKPH
jgi:hypothetical protein